MREAPYLHPLTSERSRHIACWCDRRASQQLGMVTARSVEHLVVRELLSVLPLLPGIITPWRPLLRPRVPLLLSIIPRMLAAASGLLVLLHGRHLVRNIPIVRRFPFPKLLHRPRLVGSGPYVGSDDGFG